MEHYNDSDEMKTESQDDSTLMPAITQKPIVPRKRMSPTAATFAFIIGIYFLTKGIRKILDDMSSYSDHGYIGDMIASGSSVEPSFLHLFSIVISLATGILLTLWGLTNLLVKNTYKHFRHLNTLSILAGIMVFVIGLIAIIGILNNQGYYVTQFLS